MLRLIILRLTIISIWVLVVWVGMGRTGGQYWRKSHIISGLMRRQRWVINSITPSWLLLMLYVEPPISHIALTWAEDDEREKDAFIHCSYNLEFFKGNRSAKVQRSSITGCHKVVRKSRCVSWSLYITAFRGSGFCGPKLEALQIMRYFGGQCP